MGNEYSSEGFYIPHQMNIELYYSDSCSFVS